jgi:hypothetical protein
MAHLISTKLKDQILWWQLYSIVAPSLFIFLSTVLYFGNIVSPTTILYVGISIFGATCLAWWHWCLFTMIKMLSIMKDTDEHFETVTGELNSLRIMLEKNSNQIH